MFRKITSHRDRSELEEGDDDMFSYDDVPNDDTLSSSPKTPTTPTRVSSFKQTVKTKRRVSTVFHKPTINQTSQNNNNNLNERASFSFFTSDDDQAYEQNTPRPLSQSGSSSSTSSPNKNNLTNNNKIDINNEHTFQYYQQHHQSSYEIERNNYQSLLTTNRSNKLIDFVSLFSISNEELNTIAKEQFNEATCLTLLNNNENKNYFTMTTSLQREGSLISFFPDKHLKNDENDTTTIIEEERKKKKNSELDFEISTMNLQYFTFPNDVHLKFVVTAPTDLYYSNSLNKNDNNDVKINKNHIEKDSAKDNFGNNEMNNNNPLPEELIINNEGNINEENNNNNNEEENKSEMKNNVDKEMMNEKQEEKNELNNLNNNNNFFIPEIESFESYPIQYKDFPMLSKIFGEDDNSSSTTTTATTTSVSNQNNNGSSNNNDINSYRNSISSNNSNNTENDIENDDSDGLYYDNNYNNNIKREKHFEDIDHFYPSKNFHSFIGTDGYGYRYYGFCYLKYFTFQLIPKFKDQESNTDNNISDNNVEGKKDNRFRKVLMFIKVPSCICILSRFQFHRTFLTFYSNLDQYLINNEIYLFDNSLLEYIYYLFNKNENIKLFDKLIIHFPLNKLQSNNNNNEENNKNIIQLETTVEFDKNLFIGDSDDQFKEEEKSLHDKTSTVNGSNNSENGNSGDVNKKEEQQQVKEEVSPLIEMTKKQFLFFQHLNHNNNNNNDNTKELNILKYPTCDFDFNILVNNLHIDHIIKIINYITLEKPIIFHSKYLFKLVIIMESLRYLLYPFRLTSVYIPILHEKISHFLEAPFPYMVGLHSEVLTKFWNEELDITIPGGVCIVNVDEDSIEFQNDQLEKNDINHRWTSDIISFIKDNLEKKLGTTNNNNSTNTPPPSLSSSFRNSESYSSVSFSESSSNLSSSSLSSNSNISNNISNYSLNEQQSSNSTSNINNRSASIMNNNHSIITRRRSRVVVSSPKSLSTASTTNINNSLMKQLFNNNTLDEETLSPLSAPSSFPTANSNNNSFIKKQQTDIHPIREVFLNLFLKLLQTLELFINYENYDEKKDMKLSDLFQIDKFILISELFNFTPINNLLFTNNFNYLNNFFKTQLFHFFIQKKCEIYIKKNINIYYKLFDKKLSQQTERFSLNISLLNNSYRKGYLFKRGRIRKSWKSRFFVLRDFNLIYYSNNDENQVKGQIKLNSKNTKIFPIKVNASNKQLTKNQYDLFLSELKKLDFNKEDEIPPLNEEFPTPHVFVILSMTTGRLLFCCAESEKIRDEWIKVLRVKTMDRKVFNMLQEYLSKKDIESRLKLKLSASLGDFNNITTSNTLNSNTTTTIGKGNKEEEEEKNIQIDKVFKYQPNLNIPFVKRNEYNEYLFESYYRDINNNNNNGGNNGLLFNEYNIDTYHLFELSLEDIVMNSCYNTKRKK